MAQILPIILRWVENTIRQVSYHSTPISGTFPDISKPLLQMLLYAMASGVWEMNRLLSTLLPRVELSDFNFQGPLEDALDKFVAGKPEKEWNHVIPESGLKWMEGYTYELKGILEKPLLDKIQSVVKEGIGSSDKEGNTEDEVRDELRKILPLLTEHRLQAIARTESMRAYNMGQMVELKKSEEYVQGVEFCAILDSRTTDMCQERDGLILRANDPRVWDNTPPLHPNCRSILIPIIITEEIEDTRWDEDGLKFDNLLVEEPAMIRPKDKEHIQQIMTGAAAITKKKKVPSPEEKAKKEEAKKAKEEAKKAKEEALAEAEKKQAQILANKEELAMFQQDLLHYKDTYKDYLVAYQDASPSEKKALLPEIEDIVNHLRGAQETILNYQNIIAKLEGLPLPFPDDAAKKAAMDKFNSLTILNLEPKKKKSFTTQELLDAEQQKLNTLMAQLDDPNAPDKYSPKQMEQMYNHLGTLEETISKLEAKLEAEGGLLSKAFDPLEPIDPLNPPDRKPTVKVDPVVDKDPRFYKELGWETNISVEEKMLKGSAYRQGSSETIAAQNEEIRARFEKAGTPISLAEAGKIRENLAFYTGSNYPMVRDWQRVEAGLDPIQGWNDYKRFANTERLPDTCRTLEEFIANSPRPDVDDNKLYRGVRRVPDFLEHAQVGDRVHSVSIMSTSGNPNTASSFGDACVMIFDNPRALRATAVNPFSVCRGEGEYLASSANVYEVLNISTTPRGGKVYHVRVVGYRTPTGFQPVQ